MVLFMSAGSISLGGVQNHHFQFRSLFAWHAIVYNAGAHFHPRWWPGAAGHDLFVGKDAEVKAAQDNSTNFTVLSLATKESWRNKQTNEWESRTEWHRILVFGKLGDFAATLTKGAHIEVEGTLRSREQTLELKGSSKKNPEERPFLVHSCRIHSQARSHRELVPRRRSHLGHWHQ